MDCINTYSSILNKTYCDEALAPIYSGEFISKDSYPAGDSSTGEYKHKTYPVPLNFKYHDLFLEKAKECLVSYFKSNGIDSLININDFEYESSNIDKVDQGIWLPLHIDKEYDNSFISKRNFIVILYLNTIEDGGELCFPLQQRIIYPKAGDIVIFPTFYTYPHYVTPPMSSDRYAYHINFSTKK